MHDPLRCFSKHAETRAIRSPVPLSVKVISACFLFHLVGCEADLKIFIERRGSGRIEIRGIPAFLCSDIFRKLRPRAFGDNCQGDPWLKVRKTSKPMIDEEGAYAAAGLLAFGHHLVVDDELLLVPKELGQSGLPSISNKRIVFGNPSPGRLRRFAASAAAAFERAFSSSSSCSLASSHAGSVHSSMALDDPDVVPPRFGLVLMFSILARFAGPLSSPP